MSFIINPYVFGAASSGPHRYWRVAFTAVDGDTNVNLHDVEFKTSLGGADVTGSGTASASGADAGTTAAACFDSAGNNLWSTAVSGSWIKYDFGLGNDKDILECTLTCGVNVTRAPKNFTVEWSDDNSTWTAAMTLTNITGWSIGQRRTFRSTGEVATSGDYNACRYWRIAITAVEDTIATGTEQPQISEMEYRLTVSGADQTGSGTASSGTIFAGGEATKAFDNNNGTQWSAAGGLPYWFLIYDFGSGVTKDILEVAIRNTSSHAEDGPKDFVIQRSSDGIAWTTAKTVTGSTGWTTGETRTYSWTSNAAP